MAVPPWTRDLLNTESVRQLQARASELFGELPVTAARGLDRVVRETRRGAEQVRRWARRRTSLSAETINGSGLFFHPSVGGAPLSSQQIDALAPVEDSFTAISGAARERIEGRLRLLVQQRVGQGVLVARSFPAAVSAVSAATGHGSVVAVPRGAAMRIDDGPTLPDLLAATGTRVIEIGSLDCCAREDWLAARRATAGDLYACGVRWPQAAVHTFASDLTHCPKDDPGIRRIRVVPYGAFTSIASLRADAWTAVDRESIARHTWTIVPGDRFLCGPTSGLIIGSDASLDAVRAAPLWPILQADLGTVAALVATLESPESDERARLTLASLLETSVGNLQSRCERLSVQFAAEPGIAACQITDAPARLSRDLATTVESRQLRITPTSGGGERWARRLAEDVPSILVGVDGEAIVLDLRWIPAHVDNHLVPWIAGGRSAENPAA